MSTCCCYHFHVCALCAVVVQHIHAQNFMHAHMACCIYLFKAWDRHAMALSTSILRSPLRGIFCKPMHACFPPPGLTCRRRCSRTGQGRTHASSGLTEEVLAALADAFAKYASLAIPHPMCSTRLLLGGLDFIECPVAALGVLLASGCKMHGLRAPVHGNPAGIAAAGQDMHSLPALQPLPRREVAQLRRLRGCAPAQGGLPALLQLRHARAPACCRTDLQFIFFGGLIQTPMTGFQAVNFSFAHALGP